MQYDVESIRDGLRQMLGNEQKRQQYGRERQELVRGKYGWDSIVVEMEKVYERCLTK